MERCVCNRFYAHVSHLITSLQHGFMRGFSTASCALFADDTKLYRSISSISDCESLLRDISSLNDWSQNSNMKFNALKCKVLTITRKKSPVTTQCHLGDTNLQRVQQEKDLGIMITSNLSWDAHIFSVVNKANKMLGLLKRTCPLIEHSKIRQSLYHSFVKSQLCYATEVWLPPL
jgi:hypothetical protein